MSVDKRDPQAIGDALLALRDDDHERVQISTYGGGSTSYVRGSPLGTPLHELADQLDRYEDVPDYKDPVDPAREVPNMSGIILGKQPDPMLVQMGCARALRALALLADDRRSVDEQLRWCWQVGFVVSYNTGQITVTESGLRAVWAFWKLYQDEARVREAITFQGDAVKLTDDDKQPDAFDRWLAPIIADQAAIDAVHEGQLTVDDAIVDRDPGDENDNIPPA